MYSVKEIKKFYLEKAKDDIASVISGDKKLVEIHFVSVNDASQVIKDYGLEFVDSESNGWQVDFWDDYSDPSIDAEKSAYQLYGSMYFSALFFRKL